jgi:hypothetical protein
MWQTVTNLKVSQQWKHTSFPTPLQLKRQSAGTVIISVFWNAFSVTHIVLLPRVTTLMPYYSSMKEMYATIHSQQEAAFTAKTSDSSARQCPNQP